MLQRITPMITSGSFDIFTTLFNLFWETLKYFKFFDSIDYFIKFTHNVIYWIRCLTPIFFLFLPNFVQFLCWLFTNFFENIKRIFYGIANSCKRLFYKLSNKEFVNKRNKMYFYKSLGPGIYFNRILGNLRIRKIVKTQIIFTSIKELYC